MHKPYETANLKVKSNPELKVAILSMRNIDFLHASRIRTSLIVKTAFSNLNPYDETTPE